MPLPDPRCCRNLTGSSQHPPRARMRHRMLAPCTRPSLSTRTEHAPAPTYSEHALLHPPNYCSIAYAEQDSHTSLHPTSLHIPHGYVSRSFGYNDPAMITSSPGHLLPIPSSATLLLKDITYRLVFSGRSRVSPRTGILHRGPKLQGAAGTEWGH